MGRYNIRTIDHWEPPEEDGVALLGMPNIPLGLFKLAPRTIMGQYRWDLVRKRCYMDANYTCQICGKYLGHGKCHNHEVYSYDFKKSQATFERYVCVCPACHAIFIHSGRALTLLKNQEPGAYDPATMIGAVSQRFKMIETYNLQHPNDEPIRVSTTFLDWAKHHSLKTSMETMFQSFNVHFAEPYSPEGWPKWTLKIDDKIYDSLYPTKEAWEAEYAKGDRDE